MKSESGSDIGGRIVKATVEKILPLGLLVRVDGGRRGIVRERELSWQPLDDWRTQFVRGQTIDALVLDADDESLILSIRLAERDPWLGIGRRYGKRMMVDAVVQRVTANSVYVQLEPGVNGVIERNELPSWTNPQWQMNDIFWPGDDVHAQIVDVRHNQRLIVLSVAAAWANRAEADLYGAAALPADSGEGIQLNLPADLPRQLILLVEDDDAQREALVGWFEQAGQPVVAFSDGEGAIAWLEKGRCNIVVTDFGLPGQNGESVLEAARRLWPEARRVLLTDWARIYEQPALLERLQALGVLTIWKPVRAKDLVRVLTGELEATMPGGALPQALQQQVRRSAGTLDERLQLELQRLQKRSYADSVVLFALDRTRRQVSVRAHSGQLSLQQPAVADLIYSPVRNVAEERRVVRIEDSGQAAREVRYLSAFVTFGSCLGQPFEQEDDVSYALFLFSRRSAFFIETHEAYAEATALRIEGLLEQQRLLDGVINMQRLALLGNLTRTMVHEINHRLSPISLHSERLVKQAASLVRAAQSADEQQQRVERVLKTIGRLDEGIKGLTDTAHLLADMSVETGEEPLLVDAFVNECARIVHGFAAESNIRLHVKNSPRLLYARLDKARLQQVLLNLLTNAVQQIDAVRPEPLSRVGNISLELRLVSDERRQMLEFIIADDGPGIHRLLWSRIFDLGFTQGRKGGTGLGLFIARALVEELQGEIVVNSSRRLWGSEFSVRVPVRF